MAGRNDSEKQTEHQARCSDASGLFAFGAAMSRTAVATLTLAAVAATSLSAAVAGYQLQLVEAAGVKLTANAPVDATAVSCSIDVPGSYMPSVICVDAAGNVVTHSDGTPLVITGPADPVVVTDEPVVVMVNVPASFTIALG